MLRPAHRKLSLFTLLIFVASLLMPSASIQNPLGGTINIGAGIVAAAPMKQSPAPPHNFVPVLEKGHNGTLVQGQAHAPVVSQAKQQPLSFVQNAGQFDSKVRFQTRNAKGTLFFTPDEVVFSLPTRVKADKAANSAGTNKIAKSVDAENTQRFAGRNTNSVPGPATIARLRFIDANSQPVVKATAPLRGVINYFQGNDQKKWRTNVKTFGQIHYEELYPGIDLQYDGKEGSLKGTFTVAPNSDPNQIQWQYKGATDVHVDDQGNLVVTLHGTATEKEQKPTHTLTEQAPLAWQIINGQQVPVTVAYVVAEDRSIAFSIGAYDHSHPLIIDPTVTYSNYFGGSDYDDAAAIAIDNDGNVYVTGVTVSGDFPDSDNDTCTPTSRYPDECRDAFVSKFSSDGSTLLYSTYLGGTEDDSAEDVAVDSLGNVYVTGTAGSNFPMFRAYKATCTGGYIGNCNEDAFLTKLHIDTGTLAYSTYLGGTSSERGNGVTVDQYGSVYIAGITKSHDFPGAINVANGGLSSAYGDGFVAKLNTMEEGSTSLMFSMYVGGETEFDDSKKIITDTDGNFYVVGYTESQRNIATENAYQTHCDNDAADTEQACWGDLYLAKYTGDGQEKLYSTYFGGTYRDGGFDIYSVEYKAGLALDQNNNAYIAAWTDSDDLPVRNAAQLGNGIRDGFVAKFNPSASGDNSLVYSTYVGGNHVDEARDVAVDRLGNAYVVGGTTSLTGVATDNAYQEHCGQDATVIICQDAFVAKINPTGDKFVYSTYYGDSRWDYGNSVAVDNNDNIYIAGTAYSGYYNGVLVGEPPNDYAFIVKLNHTSVPIPTDQNRTPAPQQTPALPQNTCYNPQLNCQPSRGGPFNTRTGSLWTNATDLTIASVGPALEWTRTYVSQATGDDAGPLGYGWSHPYTGRLLMPAQSGEPNTMVLVSPDGNRLRFKIEADGRYTPFAGIYSSLRKDGTTYVQTLRSQDKVFFNEQGRLDALEDAQGHRVTLRYEGDRLTRVEDATNPSQRYLALGYSPDGTRITSVSDVADRSVTYDYDTDGNLWHVTDVRGHQTTFKYTNHLLTDIINPLGEVVEHTEYSGYSPTGKVKKQTLQDGRVLDVVYAPTATTVVTTDAAGKKDVEVFGYDDTDTMTGVTRNGIKVKKASYDSNYNPARLSDGRGNATTAAFSAVGLPKTITNALNQSIHIEYNSRHLPVLVTDIVGRKTRFEYNANNNLTAQISGITAAQPLGYKTTFTYNDKKWLERQTEPDGVVTYFEYDAVGQIKQMTVGEGSSSPQITKYGYDGLGRLTSTTIGVNTSFVREDRVFYNSDDTIWKTIQNYKDGNFHSDFPDEDLITEYGYDKLGRRVWEKNVLQTVTATHYNAHGQVDWTIRNLTPLTLDENKQPVFKAFDPATPDQNIAREYRYDWLGRVEFIVESGLLTGTFNTTTRTFPAATTRTTRIEYDPLDRPVVLTLNYQPDQPMHAAPDVNVQLKTEYDNAGNVTRQQDALKRWTCTVYDKLNRPVQKIQNCENGDPLTIKVENDAANGGWATLKNSDVITKIEYTPDGQVATIIENFVDGAFTVDQPDIDRITKYTYDDQGELAQTTGSVAAADASRTDINRISTIAYDPQNGSVIGQQDALKRWVHVQYDDLGRPKQTIANCRTGSGTPDKQACAAFDPMAAPDRNVPHQTLYDDLGRAYKNVDALGHITQLMFDGVNRVTKSTANYKDGRFDLDYPDQDVSTVTTYDALGRVIQTSDDTGILGKIDYNAVDQPITVTDAAGRSKDVGYDGTGILRWTAEADGRVTVIMVDGLGRPIQTIGHFQNGNVEPTDAIDQDVISSTDYDAAGRPIRTTTNVDGKLRSATDTGSRVTAMGYDLLDQLIWVQENLQEATCNPGPCNVTTQYEYDRRGNQTKQIDARTYAQEFRYDAADRRVKAIDALGHTTSWKYDALGQVTFLDDPRTSATDPDGTANDLTFTYDELGRLTNTDAQNLDHAVTAKYDALGRRRELTDATGTTHFGYDDLGRMTSVVAPVTGEVGYRYNARGQRAQLRYPTGPNITYDYWPDGQLQSVTQGTTTLASYAYEPTTGRLASLTQSNGAVTSYGYNAHDQVTDLATVVNGVSQNSFHYELDRLGLRRVATETVKQPVPQASAPATSAADFMAQPYTAFMPSTLKPVIAVAGTYTTRAAQSSGSLQETKAATPSNGEHTTTSVARPASTPPPTATNTTAEDIVRKSRKLPLSFIPNRGQSDNKVQFQAHSREGGTLYFTPQEVVLSLPEPNEDVPGGSDNVAQGDPQQGAGQANGTGNVLRLEFDGAAKNVAVTSGESLPGVANYLLGDKPADWHTDLPTYASIMYTGLYAGIDLRYEGQDNWLKGTYTVAPGSDPHQIRWRYRGVKAVQVDSATGDLVVTVPQSNRAFSAKRREQEQSLTEVAPTAWQEVDGQKVMIAVSYIVADDGSVSFDIGTYDVTRPLVIDPTLMYSTYMGGSAQDDGNDIAVDNNLNAYIVGSTRSATYPVVGAYQGKIAETWDAFVTKLNPTGNTIVYSTYLGGGSWEFGEGIAVDKVSGEAYVTGHTYSGNFPLVNARQTAKSSVYDVFVTKLNAQGNGLSYSTYHGGNGNDYGADIVLDEVSDSAYVVGTTTTTTGSTASTTGFPVHNARQANNGGLSDAFISKFDAQGQLSYSTFHGGANDDSGTGIALDKDNYAHITGYTATSHTASPPFPVLNAHQPLYGGGSTDAFVSRFNPQGGLVYSTYLGGSGEDKGYAVAIGATSGNAFVTGHTGSTTFPTWSAAQVNNGGQNDAFVAKYNASGSRLYSTYVGGNSNEGGYGIAADNDDIAYVTGDSWSTSGFSVPNAKQPNNAGRNDAFVVKVASAGNQILYGTYFGGSGDDQGRGIALDKEGNILVVSTTSSTNLVTVNPAQASNAGGTDASILKLSSDGSQILYSTYLGGGGDDEGNGIAIDNDGNAYIVGTTRSATLPLSNARQWQISDTRDAFVAKLSSAGNWLMYSTYLGGGNWDYGKGIAVDKVSGEAYVTGYTDSSNFPTVNAHQATKSGSSDAFIAKLTAAGNGLSYSTYHGGNGGDYGYSIAVDDVNDTAFVTGDTWSTTGFPVRNARQSTNGGNNDAFISKLTALGQLDFSTLHGGAGNETGTGIAIDKNGNAYITGYTSTTQTATPPFPARNAWQSTYGGSTDAFVSKFDAFGVLDFSTYLGGGGEDKGYGIATSAVTGNVFVTGSTWSSNFPTWNAYRSSNAGASDAFVAKFSGTGSRLYSTYMGGNSNDNGYGIAVDSKDAAYITGETWSTSLFPTINGIQLTKGGRWDAFVTKLSDGGNQVLYSTYFGGSGDDFGRGIGLDNWGNTLIVGTTSSTNMQVVSAVQSSNAGGTDVFITKVSETIAPTTPTNVRSTGKTETTVSLAWDAATDNIGVTDYEIYMGIDGYYLGSTGGTTYTVTGLVPNNAYSFYVKAKDAAFNVSSPSNSVSVTTNADTIAPSVPANLRSTGKTEKTVSLAWDAATDNVGVTSYEVYNGITLAGTSTTTTLTVPGLSPSTSYSFTVKAKDASGKVSAASTAITVTTNADTTPPSTPTNFRSTGTTATTINLTWDAATDNIGVTGYDIYWYEATSSGTIQRFLGSTTGTMFTVTGRSPNTTYSLSVSAKDAAGNYSPSSTRISVTTAADTQAPTIPANLRSTGTTETTTSLAWDAATDNVGVTSYYVYKGTQFAGSSTTTTFTVTGLAPNTSTTFTVKAVDAAGNQSGASNAITATTLADTQAPTTPSNLRSTGATATTISLEWDAATDNVGVTGYEVYNGVTLTATVTGRTYMVTGLAPNTSYTFTVKAKDAAGNRSGASAALTATTIADTQAPTAPTNLRTTGTTEQTVNLAWDAATDNVAVTEYNVYRGGVLIGTTTTPTYTVSGLTPATSYTFTVKAKDGAGNVSAESSPLTISTNADTQAPTAPTNLRSTAQTATTVALAWDAASDNVGVTEYEVYNGSTRVGTTTTTSFTVDPLSAGTTYTFTIKAKDGAGNVSTASNALTVTPVDTLPPSAPSNIRSTATTATAVSLAWDAATDNVGVTGYDVYNGSTLAGTTTGTTHTLSGLTPSTSYNITVKARDAANNVSASSTALTVTTTADTEAPTSPTYFTWTAKTEASISFAWEPSSDNVGVTTYEIFYGTSSSSITTSGGTTSTTTYTVTGLKPRTAYYFKIVARDAAGNESPPTTYGSYIFTLSDTTPPTSPTNLRTTQTTETSIGLAWDAATDAVGVTGYVVYNDGVLVGTTTDTAFTVTSLTPNTTYSFTVTAKDGYNNVSEPSTALSVTTNRDVTPPSMPTNVQATSSDTSVNLVWNAASDNIGVIGYDVYYGTTLAGTTTNTFVAVNNLTPNTSYIFTVKATDAAGNYSGTSEPVTIKTTSGTMPETRTIRYTYDGLARLTDAVEDPGTTYQYAYDLSGNRTEVKVNGVLTESRSYNAANQVVGWKYDAVGNLLSDGTAARSYTYDALRRLTTATTNGTAVTSTYNGDGTLVAQTTGTATTRFTQDLAQPLAQVLQETQGGITTNHVYGYERLVSLSGMTQQWYGTDVLGSVRQTLDATGQPVSALHYDPWGMPQGATAPATFGFTGEVQDATSGLVNLRARWYQPETGTFLTRDPYPGVNGVPASRHPYQYALNAPTQYTDPSGNCPWCIAVAGGAAINAGIEYGSQVYGNYQNGMSGSAAWTSVDGRALGQAALQGAIEGGVGFVGGPWLGRAVGKGWKAAMAAGAIEGALSGVLSQLGFNWYNGCNWGNGLGGAALRGAGIGGVFGAAGYGAQKAFARAKPLARLGTHSPDVPRASGLADDVDNGASALGGSCPMRNSFSANTVVATKEGEEPISEVALGEQVLAWDERTGQTGYYTVTATISHIDPVIVRLTLDDEEIETTPEHPFYTEERGWVDAAKLTMGEHVRQADGELGVVAVVRLEERTQRMYNLTVAVAHTFFVGDEQWLVHNTNCIPIRDRSTGGTGSGKYDRDTGSGLYVLVDDTDTVRYVGIGDAPGRKSDHLNPTKGSNPALDKSDLRQVIIANNNLTYQESRGLEYLLIAHFGGPRNQLRNGGFGIKFRRSVLKRPKNQGYISAGIPLLDEVISIIEREGLR